MKKLPALLNTPARAVTAAGLIVLLSEYLIMALFKAIHGAFPTKDGYQLVMIFNYLDPILLIAIASPALYILIFLPMRKQQDELDVAHREIDQTHREWMAALNVVNDPIFLHDKQFRILRCNKAYRQCAGIPFHEIIGQPYYDIFPKTGMPLPCCLRVMEKSEAATDEEEIVVGDATYRSRTFSVYDEQGVYLHSVHILEDITKKQQAEAERQRLSEAIRQAAEAIAMVNTDACIIYINPAFTRLFGYAPDEIVGQSTAILSVTAAGTVQPDMAFRIVSEQDFFQGEALRRAKDGTIIPVYINVAALHGTKGEFGGFVAAITDLRPIKKSQQALVESEEALRKSNERFDLAVKGTNDGIWDWDIRTNANYFSPRFMELLGYGPDEVTHELATFESFLHPEDRAWVFDRVHQHLEDNVPYNVEYRLRTKNGEYRWFQARGQAIRDQSGKPFRMAGSITDITERKQAEAMLQTNEERYRQIVQTSMDGFWVADTKGRILDVNDAYCQLTGYAREELLNMRIPDVEAKETPEDTAQHILEIMTQGHARFETRHRRKDGQLLDIEVSVVHRPEKEDGRFFIFLRDITGRKKTEEKIKEQLDYLERFKKVAVKREFKIKELTDEVEKLKAGIESLKKMDS